jgi:acetylornithine deacetylase
MTLGAIQERVSREVERMQDEIVKSTQELVRIPSVVGDEAPAQAFIESLYGTIGLDVTRFQADIEKVRHHPAFIDTGMPYANRPNIIGEMAGEADSPSLILNGHVDVVSPEPLQDWTHDPWGAEIEGDKLYGRGAGDMKAGLLANFYALKAILKAGIRPKGKVMLQSVIDEEAGGAGGTLPCLMQGHTADAIICTEPHNLNVTISHAGINYFRVSVKGRTSHAGLAHLGINAVGKIIPIYQALIALDEKRGREVKFPLYEEGSGRSCHINVGTLRSGDWPSTVAGSAVMECRIGYIPGEKMADIKAMIESTIREATDRDPWLRDHPPQVEWFGWQTEPWYQDPAHSFVQTVKDAVESVLGHEATLIGRAGGIDSRFSQYFDMAAACTGPKAANIHGIDEYVEIPSIFQVTNILAMTVLKWCGFHEA